MSILHCEQRHLFMQSPSACIVVRGQARVETSRGRTQEFRWLHKVIFSRIRNNILFADSWPGIVHYICGHTTQAYEQTNSMAVYIQRNRLNSLIKEKWMSKDCVSTFFQFMTAFCLEALKILNVDKLDSYHGQRQWLNSHRKQHNMQNQVFLITDK